MLDPVKQFDVLKGKCLSKSHQAGNTSGEQKVFSERRKEKRGSGTSLHLDNHHNHIARLALTLGTNLLMIVQQASNDVVASRGWASGVG